MSVEQEVRSERTWITGEEYGRARRCLIDAQLPADAPEFQELRRRVAERDDYLFERYGKAYLTAHLSKWIAVSLDGDVLIRDPLGELIWDADGVFGQGNFAMRQLCNSPGLTIGM